MFNVFLSCLHHALSTQKAMEGFQLYGTLHLGFLTRFSVFFFPSKIQFIFPFQYALPAFTMLHNSGLALVSTFPWPASLRPALSRSAFPPPRPC